MRTVRCNSSLPEGWTEQNHRRLWKHYLAATTLRTVKITITNQGQLIIVIVVVAWRLWFQTSSSYCNKNTYQHCVTIHLILLSSFNPNFASAGLKSFSQKRKLLKVDGFPKITQIFISNHYFNSIFRSQDYFCGNKMYRNVLKNQLWNRWYSMKLHLWTSNLAYRIFS